MPEDNLIHQMVSSQQWAKVQMLRPQSGGWVREVLLVLLFSLCDLGFQHVQFWRIRRKRKWRIWIMSLTFVIRSLDRWAVLVNLAGVRTYSVTSRFLSEWCAWRSFISRPISLSNTSD